MNRDEKEEFVRGLIREVEKDVLSLLAHVPEDWDGHELRNLIADTFDHERSDLLVKGLRKHQYLREKIAAEEKGHLTIEDDEDL
jgi:hypothetical protein